MDQNFQTSFIPKKPMLEERVIRSKPVSFLIIFSVFILFAMLLATGGLYFYKSVVNKNIQDMENNLSLARNRFEPAKIAQLGVLDKRLSASSEILSKHIAITPIFKALAEITMKSVRYTNFSYSLGIDASAPITVHLEGTAVGYRSVALQSDLFAKNKNLIDPVFSSLSLDDKGNVMFHLDFTVDPSFVDYKQNLLTSTGQDTTTTPPSTIPNTPTP